jgi:nicotinamidase-related amidase
MTDSHRALVLVDIQNEYFHGPLEIQYPPRDASLARILRAVDTAGRSGIPVAVVQHELPEGAPVFAGGSTGWELHPELEAALPADTSRFSKSYASIFDGTGMADWLRENSIDTITLVGFMTNNCILGSAVGAEPLGFSVEVLSDATGAIHISNDAGSVSAEQVHTTLMALLNSNLAAVATTDAWAEAVRAGTALQGSDLGSSAMQGRGEN